ncbi:hypothetical protein SAMN06269185_1135 [Natronoarchaeum philippinense]|uniref:Uncharacterized protein n=1 Tax=Natronoarchaeum philippinense TaxID=558529 RepID=A0A285NA78_NATPI|nr:hypothetical protein [Natronoarchaeum philippinense]SNZ06340.1 hypothetical protein SAMN06269185_1135 [Natronoarchaeum philippinense]
MSDTASNGVRAQMLRALLVVAAGIVVPGLINRALHEVGLPTLGSFVFATGFFGMLVIVWYVWLRPLDIGGPIE